MSTQAFSQNYNPRSPIVDLKTGLPDNNYGLSFFQALWNRTGGGTGIIPVVTDPNTAPGLLVAAGATQADAYSVTQDWNWFGTVTVGAGAIILPLKPGNDIQFVNGGANPLNIYPPVGSKIDALAVNLPYILPAGKLRVFECWSLSQFFSFGN